MPRDISVLNSFLTAVSFSGASRRARAKTGGPLVGMWWNTPWFGASALKVSYVSADRASRRSPNTFDADAARRTVGPDVKPPRTIVKSDRSTSRPLARSGASP